MSEDNEVEFIPCPDSKCEVVREHTHCCNCGIIIYPPWKYNHEEEAVCVNCYDIDRSKRDEDLGRDDNFELYRTETDTRALYKDDNILPPL